MSGNAVLMRKRARVKHALVPRSSSRSDPRLFHGSPSQLKQTMRSRSPGVPYHVMIALARSVHSSSVMPLVNPLMRTAIRAMFCFDNES